MSPLIQNIEGLSLLVSGILILFTLRRKGKNRVLHFLAWFFLAGGIFRLGMLLPGIFGAMSGSETLSTLVSVISNSCLYFGIAGYVYIQVRYISGERMAQVALWVGLIVAALLTTFHTVGSGFIESSSPFIATVSAMQQTVMLWVFGFSALVIIASLLMFIIRAKHHKIPIMSNTTMNIGLGLMLLSWVLQKTVQGDLGSMAMALLSALPFIAVGIILLAVFLQVSSSMTPGVVYSGKTKRPVPLAIVRVIRDRDKKMLESRVASDQGRYGILVEPGTYIINVTASGFTFPTATGMGYQGEVVEIKKPMLLGFEIFVDPAGQAPQANQPVVAGPEPTTTQEPPAFQPPSTTE